RRHPPPNQVTEPAAFPPAVPVFDATRAATGPVLQVGRNSALRLAALRWRSRRRQRVVVDLARRWAGLLPRSGPGLVLVGLPSRGGPGISDQVPGQSGDGECQRLPERWIR